MTSAPDTSAPDKDVRPTRAGSGVLGARPRPGQTFRGRDPQTVAASAICEVSPTGCQARTRLYRDGRLALEGFPVADISDHLADESVTVWLDLRDPDRDDLGVLSEEFGLHPLAVEDALHHSQRPKLDRYPSHLFLTAYATQLDAGTGELMTSELAAFITRQALITVRKDDGLDIGAVIDRWDSSPDLARFGVGYLLYGLLERRVRVPGETKTYAQLHPHGRDPAGRVRHRLQHADPASRPRREGQSLQSRRPVRRAQRLLRRSPVEVGLGQPLDVLVDVLRLVEATCPTRLAEASTVRRRCGSTTRGTSATAPPTAPSAAVRRTTASASAGSRPDRLDVHLLVERVVGA